MQQRHVFNTLPLRTVITLFSQHKKKEKIKEKDWRKTVFKRKRLVITSSVENIFSEDFISNCFIPLRNSAKISSISQNESKFK